MYTLYTMGSTTIRLSEDVYERLRTLKREDETFSEAVDRLLRGGSLVDLAGFWSPDTVEEVRTVLADADDDAVADIEAIVERVRRE